MSFTLEEMKNVDIRTVDKNTLVDLKDVYIDTTLPVEERIRSFIEQVKNPYVFKVGDVAVKVVYQKSGPSMQEQFESLIKFYSQ